MLENISGHSIRPRQMPAGSQWRNVSGWPNMSLLSNQDLRSILSFLPTSLASEPLSSSHRLASSTTIFAHRIRVFDFLYQMRHFEFFHIHCRPSIPPSANSPAYSDSVTGHQFPSCNRQRSSGTIHRAINQSRIVHQSKDDVTAPHDSGDVLYSPCEGPRLVRLEVHCSSRFPKMSLRTLIGLEDHDSLDFFTQLDLVECT